MRPPSPSRDESSLSCRCTTSDCNYGILRCVPWVSPARTPFAHGARCASREAKPYKEYARLSVCRDCLECRLVPMGYCGDYWHALDMGMWHTHHAKAIIDTFPYLACHELLRVLGAARYIDAPDVEWTNEAFMHQACISLCLSAENWRLRFAEQFGAFRQIASVSGKVRLRIGFDTEGYMSLFCSSEYPRAFMSRPGTPRDAAVLYRDLLTPLETLDVNDFVAAISVMAAARVSLVWIARSECDLDDARGAWSAAYELSHRDLLATHLPKAFCFVDPKFIDTHHIRLCLERAHESGPLLVRFKVRITIEDAPDEAEPREQTFAQLAQLYEDMDCHDAYMLGCLDMALFGVPHLWVRPRTGSGAKRVFKCKTPEASAQFQINPALLVSIASDYGEAVERHGGKPVHMVLCVRRSKRNSLASLLYKFVETCAASEASPL